MNSDKETNKKKEVKAEISIEVTGEDEPTKYDIRRKRWATACRFSLLVFIASLAYGILTETDIYTGGIIAVSLVSTIVCLGKAGDIDPNEPAARHFPDSWVLPDNLKDPNDDSTTL